MTQLTLDLYDVDLDELQGITRARALREQDSRSANLADTFDLAESMAVARERIPSDNQYGEWWRGVDVEFSRQWRATLVKIGRRWITEGRPGVKPLDSNGARFSLERYANGLDPYGEDAEPDEDDADDERPVDTEGDEWYTPSWLFHALGLTFDLDVCAPVDRTHVTTPARHFLTEHDDGLTVEWRGLVWCNPPYSSAAPWAERMIEHRNGLILSHVPINGGWCLDLWRNADRVALFQGMHFVRPDGVTQRPAWWLQLAAFGPSAASALDQLHDRIPADIDARWRPGPIWAA